MEKVLLIQKNIQSTIKNGIPTVNDGLSPIFRVRKTMWQAIQREWQISHHFSISQAKAIDDDKKLKNKKRRTSNYC